MIYVSDSMLKIKQFSEVWS